MFNWQTKAVFFLSGKQLKYLLTLHCCKTRLNLANLFRNQPAVFVLIFTATSRFNLLNPGNASLLHMHFAEFASYIWGWVTRKSGGASYAKVGGPRQSFLFLVLCHQQPYVSSSPVPEALNLHLICHVVFWLGFGQNRELEGGKVLLVLNYTAGASFWEGEIATFFSLELSPPPPSNLFLLLGAKYDDGEAAKIIYEAVAGWLLVGVGLKILILFRWLLAN